MHASFVKLRSPVGKLGIVILIVGQYFGSHIQSVNH